MNDFYVNKGLVISIILLFVGASIVPSVMSEDELKTPAVTTMQTIWYVKEGGNNSNGGTNWGDTWRDINYAINNTSVVDGDTIMVGDGTYYENVIVDKTLVIEGNGSSISIIYGNGAWSVVTIEAPTVTIQKFTIQNSGSDYAVHAGIKINNSKNAKIYYNTISSNPGNGILIVGSGPGDDKNRIQNNLISNNYDGISIDSSNHNEIYQNIIKDNEGDGIFMVTCSRNVIGEISQEISNIISGNLQSGIHIYGASATNTFYKNYINNNKMGGIFLDKGPSGNIFNQNTICNNTGNGGIYLSFRCFSNEIRKNNFLNNSRSNKRIWETPHATFVNSVLNIWQANYWDDWTGPSSSYIIGGRIIFFPWPNFDSDPSPNPW